MNPTTIDALKQKDWKSATKYLSAELEFSPSDSNCAYNLVVCYIKLGKYDTAKRVLKGYRDILSLDNLKELDNELMTAPAVKPYSRKTKIPKPVVKEPALDKGGNPIQGRTKTKDGQITDLAWFKSTDKLNIVIGLHKVKRQLKKNIIGPMINPNLYKKYGAATSGAALLYGPPGTGKTLLARACCGEVGGQMLIVRINEIVSKYMGDSTKNMARIFDSARGTIGPSLIFIDELDAMAQKREGTVETTTAPEERRIIDGFLTEIDGVGKNNAGVFILGATNAPWALDDAFLRSGRFSKQIYCGVPNTKDRMDLFRFYLKNKNKSKINYLKLGLLSFGRSPADIMQVCEDAATTKAAGVQFDNKPETLITTNDLTARIKEMGDTPMLFAWFADTLEKFKNMKPEQASQYGDLKKDIRFYCTKGQSRLQLYKMIATIMR